ncbi:facilitated trehalose transporter Tret1-like [Anticarsia gemmatalis]|uniref:facilitated trehalose transporter Tret1-like n=1 Tax=Anticarsia gemmatalis TaxID=129554 RepID=UPI003F764E4B
MKNESEISKPKGHTRVQWAVAVLVNLTVLTYGFQCGWVSPMTKILQSPQSPVGRPLTDSEISWIAGVPSLTAIFGILGLLYVVDNYGRKCSVIVMASLQLISWIIKICPSTPTTLLIARIVCGLSAGGCFHVVPMYIKEISQDNIRGTLGSMAILFQNVGILTMYSLGWYLDYYTVLYLVVGLPVVTTIIFIKAPESPSFLVKKGRLEEAAATIAFLRGLNVDDKEVQNEVDAIKREDDYFKSIPNITFLNIFKHTAWRRGFLILFFIVAIHGSNGAFSIINYASTILANSDVKMDPELLTLGIPICLTIGTAITMSSVDRLGRKVLLTITFITTTLAFAGLASNLLLREHGWAPPGWLNIVALLVAVCSYGAGVSPVPFIVMSELFNFQIRAKLMACLVILAWFTTFIQLVSFTAVTNAFGAYVAFYIFAALNLIGVVLVVILLPETGGKSVDQIEAELMKGKKKDSNDNPQC